LFENIILKYFVLGVSISNQKRTQNLKKQKKQTSPSAIFFNFYKIFCEIFYKTKSKQKKTKQWFNLSHKM